MLEIDLENSVPFCPDAVCVKNVFAIFCYKEGTLHFRNSRGNSTLNLVQN